MSSQRVVLLTGASSGIGLATAEFLGKHGFRVFGSVRKTSNTAKLDEVIRKSGDSVSKVILDVTDAGSVESAVKEILGQTNRIDVLINNACDVVIGTVESCSLEQQWRSMDVNYFGAVRTLQAVLPHMRTQKSGQIINISSISGIDPYPPIETYSATKFALEGLTESMVTNLAPWGIHVSLIEPGGVRTPAPMNAPQGANATPAFAKYSLESQKKMIESYDAGKAQEPLEIAELILQVLESEEPSLRYQSGDFAKDIAKKRFKDPTGDEPVKAKRELLKSSGLYQLLQ